MVPPFSYLCICEKVTGRGKELNKTDEERSANHAREGLATELCGCWCSGDIDVRQQSAATEALLKKLVEAEVDAQTIADQAAGFADAIQRLREVRRSCRSSSSSSFMFYFFNL